MQFLFPELQMPSCPQVGPVKSSHHYCTSEAFFNTEYLHLWPQSSKRGPHQELKQYIPDILLGFFFNANITFIFFHVDYTWPFLVHRGLSKIEIFPSYSESKKKDFWDLRWRRMRKLRIMCIWSLCHCICWSGRVKNKRMLFCKWLNSNTSQVAHDLYSGNMFRVRSLNMFPHCKDFPIYVDSAE